MHESAPYPRDKVATSAAPAVSVVVPLYNKAPHVEAALRSILAQSFTDFEVIVVDDGSTDGGAEIVAGITDPRLRLLRQDNAGAGAARNAGIAAARGRWVAFLDADDLWYPDKLARQLAALARSPELVWAAGAFMRIVDNQPTQPPRVLDESWFADEEVIRDALLILAGGRPIWTGTVMVRRDVLLELGGFDPTLRTGQDTLLWVRLAIRHPRLAYVREAIAAYAWRVAGSLSLTKNEQGFATDAALAGRLLSLAGGLPPERAPLLQRFTTRLIITHAKSQIVTGRSHAARVTLALAPAADLGSRGNLLKLLTYLPARPTALACRWGIRLRQKFVPAGP